MKSSSESESRMLTESNQASSWQITAYINFTVNFKFYDKGGIYFWPRNWKTATPIKIKSRLKKKDLNHHRISMPAHNSPNISKLDKRMRQLYTIGINLTKVPLHLGKMECWIGDFRSSAGGSCTLLKIQMYILANSKICYAWSWVISQLIGSIRPWIDNLPVAFGGSVMAPSPYFNPTCWCWYTTAHYAGLLLTETC